jgi:hypothetical protein
MKKIIVYVLVTVVTVSMLTGCRRKPDDNPGDPTVNNSTEATTIPNSTTQATRPSTEPTAHSTMPDSTMDTSEDFTNGSGSSEEGTTSSESRNRNHIISRR